MEHLTPDMKADYIRCNSRLSEYPADAKAMVSVNDVLRAHYILVDFFVQAGEKIVAVGPRDDTLLLSAIGRQTAGYDGYLKWKNPLEVCATLFYGLIKNHPFHDANKRTALLTLLYHLEQLHMVPEMNQTDLELLAVRTAEDRLSDYKRFPRFDKTTDPEVLFLADHLRKNTRRVDNRFHSVTYTELDSVLRKHGCGLESPNGNYINIVRNVPKKSFLGLRSFVEIKWLGQIGFPRWTAQVGRNALKTALNVTGLTPENGFDTFGLFGGHPSFYALIDTYRMPLERLKDR